MIKKLITSISFATSSLFAAQEEPFVEFSRVMIESSTAAVERVAEPEEYTEERELAALEIESALEAAEFDELTCDEMEALIEESPVVAMPQSESALDQLAILTKQEPSTMQEGSEASPDLYASLHITPEDRRKIGQILSTMANNSVFKLLFEKKRLERLGHEVNHVHPIRFLGTVFADLRLVQCLHRIRSSGFKWDGFIDGFSQRLRQEVKAGNVNRYLPSFAAALGVSAQDLQSYINYKDYEGLVIYLLEKKR